jgi:hypothetical protein
MGWGDNRRSPKMKRRIAHRKFKERIKRRRERRREERAQGAAG